MKALKFYDQEGVPFELYLDHEKQAIMLQVDDLENPENTKWIEFDEDDIDDVIISLVELKNELSMIRNIHNN